MLHDVGPCLPYLEIARRDSRTVRRRSNANDCPLLAPQAISGGETLKVLFKVKQQVDGRRWLRRHDDKQAPGRFRHISIRLEGLQLRIRDLRRRQVSVFDRGFISLTVERAVRFR
jgi:hypothetical protein